MFISTFLFHIMLSFFLPFIHFNALMFWLSTWHASHSQCTFVSHQTSLALHARFTISRSALAIGKKEGLLAVYIPPEELLIVFFISQQFGNKVGEGQFRGKAIPTYVFPESIKTAIRDVIDEGLRDYPNPETLAVSGFFS